MMFPHDRYLTYLVVLGLSDEEISRLLEMDGLVVPDEAEFSRLRYELADRPQPFKPFDPEDEATMEWLQSQHLLGLLRGKDSSTEAFRILRSPVLRHPIEMLLLGGHSTSTVLQFLQERRLPKASGRGVAVYGNYFWNVPGLDLAEWAMFLDRYSVGDSFQTILSAEPDKVIAMADVFVERMKPEQVVSTMPN